MKGKNLEIDKEPRSFLFEDVFLSSREYKVIFCIAVVIIVLRVALFVPILLGWKLTEWQATTLAFIILIVAFIAVCILLLIPVTLVLRIILGSVLKKNIQKLEEAIRQREKTPQEQ
ncbi:hypothetical protein [Bartonella harrusi]|uniref:DUF4282 domain-containing protein n=1 Tax=Bartonella harrusi TaxID=2961895 RepID=A0ABY5EUL3_9HYPH|nr:hypothetical protein [Bartonella harrusi]UTO28183.1 hypothetical protein NMK50_08415 [Bartonella harrusi]